MRAIYWVIFAASLGVLLAAVAYCWDNRSGHSGVDPLLLSLVFAPVFVAGLLGHLLTRGRWPSAIAVEAVGFLGVLFGFFVTRLQILNQYERWIAMGMPDRNPDSSLLLAGFVFGGFVGALAFTYLMTQGKHRARRPNPDPG